MKKILGILLFLLLLTGCSDFKAHNVVGDEYIVKGVKEYRIGEYGTQYKIHAVSVNKNAGSHTFNGNWIDYYTNSFYSVGDTIKLTNSKMK